MSGFTRPGSVLLALLALAGCAKGPQGHVAIGAAASARHEASAFDLAGSTLASRHPFANFPDRGELIAYPGKVVRQDGAYTWHRTQLSEAHALHAIADGHLRLTAPSGEVLDFQYDRHIEHPSGDWTWVGHIAGHPDQQAILAFGEHAAFGSIAQPGTLPLRLTVRYGVSWLVETDPRMVAGIVNGATRPQRPDFLVPPKATAPSASAHTAAASAASMASAPGMASASTSTATTVDLVVGYTPAFASDNGGTSGAVTHLNYLVDVTNVAYTNSQINAKVRLVATVPVNYPDATSNDTTLAELTGYDSTSNTQTTPNAAFNGLRAAREQYGADLVSMVRSFREPENTGCGVAWLIGGGQSGISSTDSYFGYSVVSDGTDGGTDGKTYYCLDETLAHELGHNMGAAHDVATSKGSNGILDANEYGAYPYSFGYKSTAGNFYTVMAYGDTGQQIERIFSDPRSTFCGGVPCGITDQADNARTLVQTIPTVATFRATAVITPTAAPRLVLKDLDTNGNGTSDLLLRTHAGAKFVIWYMAGTTRAAYSVTSLANAYSLVATGDFNGDHRTDLVWTSAARDIVISMSAGTGYSNVLTPYTYDAATQIVGAADINGNGKADILLRGAAAGKLYVWYMDGTTRVAYSSHAFAPAYQFVGSGDLNKDGKQDLVWTTGQRDVLLSISTGTAFSTALNGLTYTADYDLVAVSDVNGNGTADLVLRSARLGKVVVWFMDGTARVSYSIKAMAGSYHLVGKGDFNGDHRGDLLWSDGAGGIVMSQSTGTNFTDSVLPYAYAPDYLMMDAP